MGIESEKGFALPGCGPMVPSHMTVLPKIIQGGMGVGVSNWRLARAVSRAGHLGVVSGTALDMLLARRLQMGDPGGHMAESAARFPFPAIVERAGTDISWLAESPRPTASARCRCTRSNHPAICSI